MYKDVVSVSCANHRETIENNCGTTSKPDTWENNYLEIAKTFHTTKNSYVKYMLNICPLSMFLETEMYLN